MSFLSDILNPTLLIFLGITILIIALVIVYFEGKMREQNHKISSMLSLVSSLAEETNMIKLHLTHVNVSNAQSGMNYFQPQNISTTESSIPFQGNKYLESDLIPVSDNEDDEDEEDDDDDEDDEDEDDDEDDEDEDDDEDEEDDDSEDDDYDDHEGNNIIINEINENDIKVLNLDHLDSNNEKIMGFVDHDDDDDDDDEDLDELDDLEDIEFNQLSEDEMKDEIIKTQNNDNGHHDNNELDNNNSTLKSINISSNLEEEKNKNVEVIDYKKLSLNKLKSIVLEKGLVTDPSKLKKQDLLKLLNAE